MSPRAAAWLSADGTVALWTLTPVEVVSALYRLVRDRALDEDAARAAESRLDELVRACHVVVDTEDVKVLARRLLRRHALRAFDALQLGAAVHWAEGHPEGRIVHTFDGRRGLAALREGFVVPA
jgi:predicted nucleic acid-binding protein